MDLFSNPNGAGLERPLLEGYQAYMIDEATCPSALREDLHGYMMVRWFALSVRADFEAVANAPVFGPVGTFGGVIGESLPNYWRETDASASGQKIWMPDNRHPLGKWFTDMAAVLLSLPSIETLTLILRRHGLNGSTEPVALVKEVAGGWAVLLHGVKKHPSFAGCTRDDGLFSLWDPEKRKD